MRVYASNPTLASKSPCAAATKAYARAELASASTPTKAALFAFIDSAILSNDVGVDPVCAAAANAYFDSFVAGAGRDQNGIIGIDKSNEYHMPLHSLNTKANKYVASFKPSDEPSYISMSSLILRS